MNMVLDYLHWSTAVYCGIIAGLFLLASAVRQPPFPSNAPPLAKESYPVLGALRFFKSRRSFCQDSSRSTKTGNYSFHVGKHRVVGLSGLEGRKAFYESKELSMFEGYSVLLSATPDIDPGAGENQFVSWFNKTITKLLKRENFVKNLPIMVNDATTAISQLLDRCAENRGVFDPFDDINKLVYQLNMRTLGATEIAESPSLLDKSLRLVDEINQNNSTARIIFPFAITPTYLRRFVAAGRLYLMFRKLEQDRRRTGRREQDTLQFLMDEGEDTLKIIMFIVASLFAGQLNSGVNAAWVLCRLAADANWAQRVRAEVESAVAKRRTRSEQTDLDVLRELTIDDWESCFPTTNLCLQESIRLHTVGAAFRKNMTDRNVPIGKTGEVIPRGGFAALHIDDVHMNPDIYTNPSLFDPGRFSPDRAEDKKAPLAYGGWGHGRHFMRYER
ncbi:cytochrome P450 6A1 [Colletotrichum graminicola M1.001]|uniref:Cytochrome P450 6A1 n=1 Tax=Colletotrichum graminicola (strain M1.001 / M2 / FGSC 10212) TaxID=645133 RepID=E3QWI9_COLGM|nr:cytochrome P450 6A1 [Colletotrichum graminicola M1.001]EFQ35227.1 cytochrome P450 6A1 [Colletotrichum graminicola M1.001]